MLINYLNLIKESIQESAAHRCSVAIIKIQKHQLADILQSRCSSKVCNIQRKTPVLESLFNKVASLQLPCEYCKIFKNSFFHKTLPVAASEKFINFPGKHQPWRHNRLIFLTNMTE